MIKFCAPWCLLKFGLSPSFCGAVCAVTYRKQAHKRRRADHFEIPRCLGVPSASLFWTTHFDQLEATSIVPNARFKGDGYFNGPFARVLNTRPLLERFEDLFVCSVRQTNGESQSISSLRSFSRGQNCVAKIAA